ncbi:hypothetical protein D3C85_983460 [compost metagenome]
MLIKKPAKASTGIPLNLGGLSAKINTEELMSNPHITTAITTLLIPLPIILFKADKPCTSC